MIWTTLILLVLFIGASLPIAAAMGLLAISLTETFSFMPLTAALGDVAWMTSTKNILLAIPLYIMMGEVLLRAGIAERMYNGMACWLSWLPGGLMHSNFGACSIFAATSGSSTATAATVGTVAMPEMDKHGYDRRLFLGTLAAGGTLGILIPPSTNLILYGLLTETSIPTLYLAGFIPGFVLVGMFMLMTLVLCLIYPQMGGRRVSYSWRQRWESVPSFAAPIAIFLLVVGSIYTGFATPAESAALGLAAAMLLAAKNGRFNWPMLRDAVLGGMRTTAMSMAILIAAFFLNFVIGAIGLTAAVNKAFVGLGLSPIAMLTVVVIFYFILGMFMDTLTMMVATIPVVVPAVVAAGFDPIWFGIVMMVLIEMALVTPPVGSNLFVIQSIRTRGSISDVMIGIIPYVFVMFVFIVLITIFPGIVMIGPELIGGK